ncbi:FAD-dependent oxidoreductase [Trinickia dinghuensis]
MASACAVNTLRMEAPSASIRMVCAEPVLPYHRPPLTKGFLSGTADAGRLAIHPAGFYEAQGIDVLIGAEAVRVDTANHVVHLADGRLLGYRKLLIATGTRAIVPEVAGVGAPGVYCLHDQQQAVRIRAAAARAKRAVVMGAGFVGIESAASLRAMGIEVTLIEREPRILSQLRAPVLSDFFARLCVEHGVQTRTGCSIARFVSEGSLIAVELDDGSMIPCELAIVAIGVQPNCEFLDGSGLAVDDGVVVDECLRASDPDVFAAGDVANFFDPVFGLRRRIEHVDNARQQGQLAARNMAGQRVPYRDVSMFWGDAFDLPYNFLGKPEDGCDLVERGTLEARSYSLLYLKNNILRAIFSLGRDAEETAAAGELIRHRIGLHAARSRLADSRFDLDSLPSQTALILQGGGALGSFEWGAIEALEEAGVCPDIISAVSIGALNAAIVASHPGHAARALAGFWRDISIELPAMFDPCLHGALVSAYSLWFGVPHFLQPKWWRAGVGLSALPASWTSWYDTEPAKALIGRYIDFDALASSPVRLLLGAVDILTGERRTFDSYVDRLTPDHLLASGSLPPGMPWTTIDGRAYWDGGIVSNSPLDMVIERCGRVSGRVFIVDLYSQARRMPSNLVEVMLRRDEIVYTDRVRNDLRFEEYASDFRDLVNDIVSKLDSQAARRVRQMPHYIRLMGNRTPLRLSRIALEGAATAAFARDFDFSAANVNALRQQGRLAAQGALKGQADGVTPA